MQPREPVQPSGPRLSPARLHQRLGPAAHGRRSATPGQGRRLGFPISPSAGAGAALAQPLRLAAPGRRAKTTVARPRQKPHTLDTSTALCIVYCAPAAPRPQDPRARARAPTLARTQAARSMCSAGDDWLPAPRRCPTRKTPAALSSRLSTLPRRCAGHRRILRPRESPAHRRAARTAARQPAAQCRSAASRHPPPTRPPAPRVAHPVSHEGGGEVRAHEVEHDEHQREASACGQPLTPSRQRAMLLLKTMGAAGSLPPAPTRQRRRRRPRRRGRRRANAGRGRDAEVGRRGWGMGYCG